MRSLKAFTLVELLVVIGIIALLISILLPSLTRARSSANLVACQSNFRQVYYSLMFYAGDNKGFLPIASQPNGYGGAVDTGNGTNSGTLIILSRYLGTTINDDKKDPLSKVFTCTEALGAENSAAVWAPNMIHTIQWNPKAFPSTDEINTFRALYPQRKLAGIANSSGKMAYWDGQQLMNWNATSEPGCVGLDNFRFSWGHMWTNPATNSYDQGYLDGNPKLGTGINKDGDWWDCGIRFRHMRSAQFPRGSTTPVAFFDGHVETRKVGEIYVNDLTLNPSN